MLQNIRSAVPDIRAKFDLHLTGRHLAYFKDPCDLADMSAGRFFLHVFPENEADLPASRKRYGFDNLDFDISTHGKLIKGSCVAIAYLPDYPIASIRTGQYDEQGQLWDARLPMAD